ncbi:hypothetical protein [Paracidovorax konjaci]|uniref:hypothetical protein n=1 Tax=Paracidovorax konjaci TaxID=32040 RepID=UPI0011139F33|nr:hypothetical protein [Paracidovorax konjaci]
MSYLLIPKIPGQSSIADIDSAWTTSADITLDGFFYDHLLTTDGAFAGVRYWIEPGTVFDKHPVFSSFLEDERFQFNSQKGYVDIVFDSENIKNLRMGMLKVHTVQDFGGESVVKKRNLIGIAFDL